MRPIQIQVCSFLQRLITHHYENLNKKHLFLLHLFIRGFVYSDDPQLAKSLLLPLIAGVSTHSSPLILIRIIVF